MARLAGITGLPVAFSIVCSAADAPKPELSTPRLGALCFVRAMELNDLQVFKSVTIGGDDDYKLFEPLLNMVGAAKQLEKAARDKFGKAGVAVVRQSPAVGLEVQVQESDVRVNGDNAVLFHKGQEDDPITLRKGPVGWKVDLTAINNRQRMAAAAPGMRAMQKAFGELAQEIREGKYKSPQEAEKAVIQRMQQAAGQAR
jgi:hypothetical protein